MRTKVADKRKPQELGKFDFNDPFMNIGELREKLHAYIDAANELQIQALYEHVKTDMESRNSLYDAATMNMLFERREKHRQGISRSYTAEESLSMIRSMKDGASFDEEIASRFAELESGKVRGYTIEETEERAREAYKVSKKVT